MKIWTISSDSEAGAFTEVAYTEEAANTRATAICAEIWEVWFETTMPSDWRAALGYLGDRVGFIDTLSVTEHDISGHPLVAELITEVVRFRATHEFYARKDDRDGDAEGAKLKRLSAAMLDDLLARVGAAPDRKEVA